MPDLDPSDQHERRQDRDDQRGDALADHDETPGVQPVGEGSRQEVEDDGGDGLRRGDVAEDDHFAGDVVEQPALGRHQRLLRRDAPDEAEPVAAVVPPPEDDEELEASGKEIAHGATVLLSGHG